jgi:hypothetical protein
MARSPELGAEWSMFRLDDVQVNSSPNGYFSRI